MPKSDWPHQYNNEGASVHKKEILGSLFWIGIGLLFLSGAIKYGIYEGGAPGPGLIPFLGSTVLICLAVSLSINAYLKARASEVIKEAFFPEKDSFKKIILTVMAAAIYGIILEYIGFVATSFFFILFLMKFIEPQKWRTSLATSLLTAITSYLLFQKLLQVQLPIGALWGK